jgi:hypothetical protein
MSDEQETQTKLDGMPEEKKVTPRFLHIAEIGANEFGLMVFLLQILAHAPRGSEEDADVFKRAWERVDSLVMEQLGLRAWQDAVEDGLRRYNEIMTAARERTAEEDGDE